jgi:hypothetical protein
VNKYNNDSVAWISARVEVSSGGTGHTGHSTAWVVVKRKNQGIPWKSLAE